MDDKAEKPEKPEKPEKQNEAPQFDWVNERFQCSLPNVFKTLRLQVEEDVKTRNGLRPSNSPYEFSVTEDSDAFTVLMQAKDVQRSVIFSLAGHAILVRDGDGGKIFEVTLTFNDKGECKLNVNEKERELWQVRRMALEDLMFRAN